MQATRRLFARYGRALHERPVTTKVSRVPEPVRIHYVRLLHGKRICRLASQAVTSAAISAVGDITSQLVFEERDALDWRRLSTFTVLGGVLVAPTLHAWYSFLHRRLPGDAMATVGRRLLLDQLAFAPTFIPSFMMTLLLLEGHAHPARKVRHEWWPAMLVNWQLWVPAQLINFRFVPVHFQVLFANGVAVVWNVYLSWAAHRVRHHEHAGGTPAGT